MALRWIKATSSLKASFCSLTSEKQFFSYEKMRLGILPEHGFKHKDNHHASLPWFGTKIAQKYAIKGSKYSGCRRDVKPHVLTFVRPQRLLHAQCSLERNVTFPVAVVRPATSVA